MTVDGQLQAIPYTPIIERYEVVSKIMRELMKFETIFSDYTRACADKCGECEACQRCLGVIAYMLAKPESRIWEVWEDDEVIGVLMLTRIVQGMDAEAHYAFFDGKLRGREHLLEEIIEWAFHDHPGWVGLRRITIAIPDYAFALAAHAQKYLGFGGDFDYTHKGRTLKVEGVRRKVVPWRGVDRDLLLLGRIRQ